MCCLSAFKVEKKNRKQSSRGKRGSIDGAARGNGNRFGDGGRVP